MRRAPLVLAATSLAAFTATLDNTVVAVALHDVQADLGAGVTGLQGVVTGYTVALAALLLTGTPFSLITAIGVSFFLAFRVALRSRGIRLADRSRIHRAIRWRMRIAPMSFLLPPRTPAP